MAQQEAEYALSTNVPWADFPNPGNHHSADGMINVVEQRDADAVFNAEMIVYTSQENVKQAAIGALNKAVPKQYKHTAGIGMANYKTNQNIRDIMAGLRAYLRCADTRQEKRETSKCLQKDGSKASPSRNYSTA